MKTKMETKMKKTQNKIRKLFPGLILALTTNASLAVDKEPDLAPEVLTSPSGKAIRNNLSHRQLQRCRRRLPHPAALI